MTLPRGPQAHLLLGVVLALAGGVAAYVLFGGLGVLVLGIGVMFVAVRVDLERDAPVGADMTEGLFASTASARLQVKPEERSSQLMDALAFDRLNTWAQVFGALLGMTGLGLMWW